MDKKTAEKIMVEVGESLAKAVEQYSKNYRSDTDLWYRDIPHMIRQITRPKTKSDAPRDKSKPSVGGASTEDG